MIKIITIDLDGTLFDYNKKISEENKKALMKAKELGVKIVITTGRPLSGVMPTLKELNLTSDNDYVIIYNGAKVFNVGTGETIFNSSITGKTVKELYYESKRLCVHYHAFRINEELITVDHNPYTDVEATINHTKDYIYDFEKIEDDELFIKAMHVDSKDNVTRVMRDVNPKFYTEFSMVRSSEIFLEFLNKNTDKGKALIALANHLNIPLKNTMAIGDAGNDLPMIVTAGVGVAMENAYPEVKGKADFITLDNEHSGVAYAINKFILNQKD